MMPFKVEKLPKIRDDCYSMGHAKKLGPYVVVQFNPGQRSG